MCVSANATHIVGGALSMKWESGNTYTITLKVLRDCFNGTAPFDGLGGPTGSACIVGVFDMANNKRMEDIDMGAPTVTKLVIEGKGCSAIPNACTQSGIYTVKHTFSAATYKSNVGYYFVYERCCRNSIIQNIAQPGNASIAIYMEVPPLPLHNSTPEFTKNPFTFLCTDNLFKYNFDFVEPDGDSLHYSMVTPLNGDLNGGNPVTSSPNPGPYANITWLPGFTDTTEVKGNPPLKIDGQTGEVSMNPILVGTFVAAFKVEEYRFGKKLGETRLELQFNIIDCMNPAPKIELQDMLGAPLGNYFVVKIPDSLCFKIKFSDPYDSLWVKISSPIFSDSSLKSRATVSTIPTPLDQYNFQVKNVATTTFCLKTDCSLTGKPDQLVKLETTDNGCPFPKSTVSNFTFHIDSIPHTKPLIAYRDQDGSIFIDTDNNHFTKHIRIPESACFDIIIQDTLIDSMYIDIDGIGFFNPNFKEKPTLNTPSSFMAKKHAESQFCWQTGCSLTGAPPQLFNVKVTNGGCSPITDATPFTVIIDSMPLVSPPDLLCMTLVSSHETMIDFGDSTLNDPYYYNHHIYRAVNKSSYELLDSITSRQVKGVYVDHESPSNQTNNYQYYIKATNLCGIEGGSSDTAETNANTKPTPDMQKLLTVTVEDNSKIKIIWPQTWEKDFARYFLYRSRLGNNSFQQVADFNKMKDTVYIDNNVDVQSQSYCYYLIMKDTCQNYSPMGQISCSILLTGQPKPFVNNINWNPYTYWDNGTKSYSLFKGDVNTPIAFLSEVTPTTLTLTDNNLNRKTGEYYYYVIANQVEGPTANGNGSFTILNSRSNNLELVQPPMLYIPNAFTPNGDNVNDEWELRDEFVKDYEVRIYNRWGGLIFTSIDKNVHWKGELPNNQPAPEDVYVYMAKYTGYDGSLHYEKGNVTIIR